MWQLYLAALLSSAAVATTVLDFRLQRQGNGQLNYYRPLTTLLISLVALLVPLPVGMVYKGAILLGLLLSLLADLLRLVGGTPPVVGAALALHAYLLYCWAFASQTAWRIPTPWVLLLLIYGGLYYRQMAPYLRELKSSILVYMVIIGWMSWQALELGMQTGAIWGLLAVLAALLFVIADSLRAIDAWRRPLARWALVSPAAYVLAQWLVAASVWGGVWAR
jgi:uncharacterized membrane protein YhhN